MLDMEVAIFCFCKIYAFEFFLEITQSKVQPWWLGSLARYLSHSVEEVHLAISGSNPALGMLYQLFRVQKYLLQIPNCRTLGLLSEVYDKGPRVLAVKTIVIAKASLFLANMSDAQSRPSLEFGVMNSHQYQPLSLTQEKHQPHFLTFDP